MKTYSKIIIFIITFLVCIVTIYAANDLFYNGGAGAASKPTNGECNSISGFCLWNAKNGSKGIRVSIAYCDSNGCKSETSINGKSVPSYHDYFYKDAVFPMQYKYFGKTKIDQNVSGITVNSAIQMTSFPSSNMSLVTSSDIELFKIPDGGGIYFNDIMELTKDTTRNQKIAQEFLNGFGIKVADIQAAANKRQTNCVESTGQQCPGYRILIEPIFWYLNNNAQTNWLITPTELFYIAGNATYNDNKNPNYVGSASLYRSANSLYVSLADVYFQRKTGGQNDVKEGMQAVNNGYGLNIINPLAGMENKLDCSIIKSTTNLGDIDGIIARAYANKSITFNKTYFDRLWPNGITFGDGLSADPWWYVNECTCYGMYNWYDQDYINSYKQTKKDDISSLGNVLGTNWFDRLNTIKMPQLTYSNIRSILSAGSYDKTQENYANTLNGRGNSSLVYWSNAANTKFDQLNCGGTTYKDSCTALENWYNTNKPVQYKPITSLSKNQILDTNQNYWEVSNMFKAYNLIYANATGKYWDHNKYINQCISGNPEPDPDPDPEYNCTPSYGVGNCLDSDSIHYSDSTGRDNTKEYWDSCIFNDNGYYDGNNHKTSSDGRLTYYEENLGSNYCAVYCTEEMTATFDSGNFTVKAGSNFVWGGSVVKGSRTCKTKSVEWSEFRNDLNRWNTDIEKAYNEYLAVKYQQDTLTSTAVDNCPRRYSYSCTKYRNECTRDENGKKTCVRVPYEGTCYSTAYDKPGYDYDWDGTSYGSGSTYASSSGGSTHCSSRPSFPVSSKYNEYTRIKNNANAVYNSMKSCYTWDSNDIYKVDPSAQLNYSDGYYHYSDAMDSSTKYQSVTENSVCKETTVPVLTSCSGTKCKVEYKKIKQCESVSMTRKATTNFSLSSDAYRYVLKSNHLSIHASELGNYTNPNFVTNYTDVGYGNLPVSYGTKDGVYGYGHSGELSINYSHLGHTHSGESSTAVDTILKATDNNYGKWDCQYTVKSELIPEKDKGTPKGIRVIYRPIDLYDPFPDMDATGRRTGANWCATNSSCDNRNATVQKYILNNRNVVGEDIYKEDPMYTFILTPAIVKEIRNYNKSNGYDEYTGSLNGQNYDFVCKKGTGGTCISEYLTHLIDITNARNYPGACVQDRFRSVNDSNAFNNCRY